MKWLLALVLLVGCHTHEHTHPHEHEHEHPHEHEHSHANHGIWEQIGQVRNDIAAIDWQLKWKVAGCNAGYANTRDKLRRIIERLEILEELTGGRRYVLQKELIELGEKK